MIFKANKELDTAEIIEELKALGYEQISCHGNHPDGYCEVEIHDEIEWDQAAEDAVNQALSDHDKSAAETARETWQAAIAWARQDAVGTAWSSLKTYHQNLLMNVPEEDWAAATKTSLLNDYEASQA